MGLCGSSRMMEQVSACVEEGYSGTVWQLKNGGAGVCLCRRGLK